MTNETKKAIFEKYKEWRLLTKEDREKQGLPLTQREFSIHHGITEKTLSLWNDKIDEVVPSDEDTLITAIKNFAMLGKNPMWARLYWDIQHPKNEPTKGDGLSADDYIDIGRKFRDGIIAEYESGGVCPVCHRFKEVCEKPRLDTEPEQQEDREVAAVELSTRPD